MAIEAVAGISQGLQADAARHASAATSGVDRQAEASPPSEAADAFRETMGRIHDEVVRFQADGQSGPKPADPVEAAKAEMLPSPWKASPAGDANAAAKPGSDGKPGEATAAAPAQASPANGAVESNSVLRKSFDHAIFITLVSQVVGGISQTTSTLIRQQ
jgi:hypothetical protein